MAAGTGSRGAVFYLVTLALLVAANFWIPRALGLKSPAPGIDNKSAFVYGGRQS